MSAQCEREFGVGRCTRTAEYTWHWGDMVADRMPEHAGKTGPVCEECAALLWACDYGITRDGWSEGDVRAAMERLAIDHGITKRCSRGDSQREVVLERDR